MTIEEYLSLSSHDKHRIINDTYPFSENPWTGKTKSIEEGLETLQAQRSIWYHIMDNADAITKKMGANDELMTIATLAMFGPIKKDW